MLTAKIIMELCRGGSPAACMKTGKQFDENELREVATCCLLGINTLHQSKIIHRVGCRCGY